MVRCLAPLSCVSLMDRKALKQKALPPIPFQLYHLQRFSFWGSWDQVCENINPSRVKVVQCTAPSEITGSIVS